VTTSSHLLTEILGTAYLLLPLLGGAVAHGACMKYGWLASLARPIDAGRSFGGRPLFGRSKTYRGPVTVAAGAAAVFALQRQTLHPLDAFASIELVDYATLPGWWFGALAGAAAELSELPNSFVKRRLGIGPGGTTGGALGVVFYLWDQLDVLLGFWLVFATVVPPTPLRVAVSVAIVATIHPLLALIGFLLGMRATAR
jgi:CDP-diglyceride synthetase